LERYVRAMPMVKMSELKSRLTHCLKLVSRGETVLVTSRDRVVARIVPAGGSVGAQELYGSQAGALQSRGLRRPAQGKLPRHWLADRLRVDVDVVGALLQERRGSDR